MPRLLLRGMQPPRRKPKVQRAKVPAASANEAGALSPVRAGSDFMLDVIKSLGFEYVAANPGSSYRSLHESTINYGGNRNPELLTCLHEEASVAIGSRLRQDRRQAHGRVHVRHGGTAARGHGHLQRLLRPRAGRHFVGNDADMTNRSARTDMNHSAQDVAHLVAISPSGTTRPSP